MYTYPHTIDNGAGERITFLRRATGPDGERLELENCVQPGHGPPMHVHYLQAEGGTVVQGRMGYQRPGEAPRFAAAGESVHFPAGEPHRFWNAGTDELRCTGWIAPPHNVEYFLAEVYDSTRRHGGTRPGALDAAYLSWRYRAEFAMVEVPAPVRRIVFPLLVLAGTLLGRFRRYAGAPPPVRG